MDSYDYDGFDGFSFIDEVGGYHVVEPIDEDLASGAEGHDWEHEPGVFMPTGPCPVEDCDNETFIFGFCEGHAYVVIDYIEARIAYPDRELMDKMSERRRANPFVEQAVQYLLSNMDFLHALERIARVDRIANNKYARIEQAKRCVRARQAEAGLL